MKQNVEFQINDELYKKFKISILLSQDDPNDLIEVWMQKYIQAVFAKEAGIESKEEISDNNTINKIRKWALKTNVPHKLIKSFLQSYNPETGACKRIDMFDNFICKDKIEDEETYLKVKKQFTDNYSQMKSNSAHAHGNVFYDDGEYVYLVSDVKKEILKLKDKFLV